MQFSMVVNQIKLLSSLAKRLESEKKDRAQIVASLQSAKILTKKENLTGHYSNLKRVVTAIK
jgi:hypothetical protein